MFLRLYATDLKRIRERLAPLFFVTTAFAVCLFLVISVSDRLLYKEASIEAVSVGLVAHTDSSYAKMAYSLITDMDSYQTTCSFTEISSEEEGLALLENGSIRALVIVPDDIITSILQGEDNPVRVYYNQDGTLETHMLNAVFLATASMMTTSQAATTLIYQTASSLPLSGQELSELSEDIDSMYLERVLSRTELFVTNELRLTGDYDTYEYYTCSGLLLLLSFSGIVFLPFAKVFSPALMMQLKRRGANRFFVLCSHFFALFLALYLLYLYLFLGCRIAFAMTDASFLNLHTQSLILILPVICFLDALILIAGHLPASYGSVCLLYVSCILMLSYLGGGIVPVMLLPDAIKAFATHTPFYPLLRLMCKGCYGSIL